MTDYTELAIREATVRLADGTEVDIFYNPAGHNGWLVDVIGAYDPYIDEVIYWGTDGGGLGHTNDIVEKLE